MDFDFQPEGLTENEQHALSMMRTRAILDEWVQLECGTCGVACDWPNPEIAVIEIPDGEGGMRALPPMCASCSRYDSEATLERMRWGTNQRRVTDALAPLLDIVDVPLTPKLKDWLTGGNKALLMHGDTGLGKTTQIKALMQAFIRKHSRSAAYYTEASLYAALTRFDAKEEVAKNRQRIQSAGMLVIDDFGTATHSDYRDEMLFEIVDHVYRTKRFLVILTNLTEEKLWGHIEDRVKRRIHDMAVKPVDISAIWKYAQRAERPPRAMEL